MLGRRGYRARDPACCPLEVRVLVKLSWRLVWLLKERKVGQGDGVDAES